MSHKFQNRSIIEKDLSKGQISPLIIISICSIIILIWFNKGLMLGYAENGLPFYYPAVSATSTSFTWTEAVVLCGYALQATAMMPFFIFI